MGYKLNVSCSETLSKIWTPTAIDCYRLGCRCSKCFLYKLYFQHSKCRMKETVMELVRLYGKPDDSIDTQSLSKVYGGKYERLY